MNGMGSAGEAINETLELFFSHRSCDDMTPETKGRKDFLGFSPADKYRCTRFLDTF